MLYYFHQSGNATMWTYCALHGSYGLLWCLKSHYFGDRAWEEPLSTTMFIKGSLLLGGYFIFPYMIASRSLQHGSAYLACVVFTYALGVFLHFSADMQKHTTLSMLSGASLPPQLITTGLFTYTRNPNYLGELLIYSSFVALTGPHPFCAAYLLVVMVGLWLPNMRRKDASLSRYQGFEAYRNRTGLIFPTKLW
jgi:protein-S-isoprenylcysteine O-methyltransferase Ste14